MISHAVAPSAEGQGKVRRGQARLCRLIAIRSALVGEWCEIAPFIPGKFRRCTDRNRKYLYLTIDRDSSSTEHSQCKLLRVSKRSNHSWIPKRGMQN
jgi:hypothetical protein